VGNVSASTRAPVAAAIRSAAASPAARVASPPTSSTHGSPEVSACAASRIASGSAGGGDATGSGPGTGSASVPSTGSQLTSAGSTSVATCPARAAATAAAASAPISVVRVLSRTQPDTAPAIAAMSDCSGASYFAWVVAWSPTTLTTGVPARRALCRLARPLARPGPRCSRVAAGRSAIRAYPSAAPVATPSNRVSTARISGTLSSAATKCISEVPGLAKQVSTPLATSDRSSARAPFMGAPFIRAPITPARSPTWRGRT
jgi:hypothetical protein